MKKMLAENIKKYRMLQGLSQEQLAQKLEVSNQAVSKWECAVSYPDIELLVDIAELFEIRVDELLRGNGENQEGGKIGETKETGALGEDGKQPGGAENETQSITLSGLPDDGILRVVQCIGSRIVQSQAAKERMLLKFDTDEMKKRDGKDTFRIEIMGNADIEGDVAICGAFTARGVNCKKIRCTKELQVNGGINCGDIECTADITANGGINCGNVECGGNLHADGGMNCGNVKCGADFKVDDGDVDCGNVECGADFTVSDGDLNCGDIEAGQKVEVRGDVSCGKVEAGVLVYFEGNADCEQVAAAQEIKVSGALTCDKVQAKSVQCGGFDAAESTENTVRTENTAKTENEIL